MSPFKAFCYDDENRLVWVSSQSGSVPCGGTLAAGMLASAGYTNTYAYDSLNRLTTGPAGSYTYGDSAHLHDVTSTSDHHGYAYDASGNATCRTASTTTPCSGTPSGAALSYTTRVASRTGRPAPPAAPPPTIWSTTAPASAWNNR